MSPSLYPIMLKDLCSIGVAKRRITIPMSRSELPTIDGSSSNWPKANADAAKGRVSSNGAFELMLPSLLCPSLRFTKEPTESPTMHPSPRVHPIVNAVAEPPPK